MGLGTDAGQHEKVRRPDRSGGQDHLAVGLDPLDLSLGKDTDAARPSSFNHKSEDEGVAEQREVRAITDRVDEGFLAPAPTTVLQRRLKTTTALLGRSVEVGVMRNANGLRRRQETLAQGMAMRVGLDAQRPIRSMVIVRNIRVSLGAAEIGQDIVVAPSCVSHRLPSVIIATVASDIIIRFSTLVPLTARPRG
jgi:hypothetical protein